VCAKFGVITRDFTVWLLGDFVLKPSENFQSIFLKQTLLSLLTHFFFFLSDFNKSYII